MLHRSLHRASTWNSSVYVCLPCRQRLIARASRLQARHHSSHELGAEEVDDWVASFNSINAPKPDPTGPFTRPITRRQREAERKSTSKQQKVVKLSRHPLRNGLSLKHEPGGPVLAEEAKSPKQKEEQERGPTDQHETQEGSSPAATAGEDGFPMLQASLKERIDTTPPDRKPAPPKALRGLTQAAKAELSIIKRPSPSPRRQALMRRITRTHGLGGAEYVSSLWRERNATKRATRPAVEASKDVDSLIASLAMELPGKIQLKKPLDEIEASHGAERGRGKKANPFTSRHRQLEVQKHDDGAQLVDPIMEAQRADQEVHRDVSSDERHAVVADDIKVPPTSSTGKSAVQELEQADIIDVPVGVTSEVSERKTNPFDSSSVSPPARKPPVASARSKSTSGGGKSPSLIDRMEEMQRRPAWGVGTLNASGSNASLSFDSLRKADQVSAAPNIATAIQDKPWGLLSVRNDAGFADTPGDLPEHSAPPKDSTPPQDVASPFVKPKAKSFFGRSLDSLKSALYGDIKTEEQKNTEGEMHAAEVGLPVHAPVREESKTATETTEKSEKSDESDENEPRLSADETYAPKDPPTSDMSGSFRVKSYSSMLPVVQRIMSARETHEVRNGEARKRKEKEAFGIKQDPDREPQGDIVVEATASAEAGSESTELLSPQGESRSPPGLLEKQAELDAKPNRRGRPRKVRSSETVDSSEFSSARKSDSLSTKSEPSKEMAKSDSKYVSLEEAMTVPQVNEDGGSTTPETTVEKDIAQEEAAEQPILGAAIESIEASALEVTALDIKQPTVPGLSYGLDRVLFNPGVYQLQDPHSRVYNFDPYLQKIMPVVEFDFNSLKEYKTSSQDQVLSSLAKDHEKKYVGSTSSMTGTLSHFHYLLSHWRDINTSMLSREFPDTSQQFTLINRAPNAIFLRWKNGTYAIDADKEFDGANVLMMLGKSMEKLLTMPAADFERYRKSDPREVSEEERTAPEAFQYTTMGDFLMRSQLDAHDPRLPGTGMFDLKTRAVVSVRMDSVDFNTMAGYQIHTMRGKYESYEREYYDMIRSTMLKYMLQARMGRMDGIFVAYHNVERIFGFQYMPISEIDKAIHGQTDPCLGDQEFKLSLELMNRIFEMATKKFPEQSLRFHFETRAAPLTAMYIYAEPMPEDQIDEIQNSQKCKIAEFEAKMMGIDDDTRETMAENRESADEAATEAADQAANTATETETESKGAEDTTGIAVDDAVDPRDMSSTESPADRKWIKSIDTKDSSAVEDNLRPLFAATLIAKSTVNGEFVDRPVGLTPSDQWSVEYILKEINDPTDAWASYEGTKARRKKMFDKFREEDDKVDGAGETKVTNYYISYLRDLAKRGREWRDEMDQLDADREKVVVGQPLQGAGWLYKRNVRPEKEEDP